MQQPIVSLSLNLELFLRVFGALFWGVLYAFLLQHTRQGQYLAQERTWLSVVIGIGVDLGIAYPHNWWVVFFVIAASSLGVITRSLWNEAAEKPRLPNKSLWSLEDATATVMDTSGMLYEALEHKDLPKAAVILLGKAIANLTVLKAKLRDVRYGEHHNNAKR